MAFSEGDHWIQVAQDDRDDVPGGRLGDVGAQRQARRDHRRTNGVTKSIRHVRYGASPVARRVLHRARRIAFRNGIASQIQEKRPRVLVGDRVRGDDWQEALGAPRRAAPGARALRRGNVFRAILRIKPESVAGRPNFWRVT